MLRSALKWVLDEPDSGQAEALARIEPDLMVPDFWLNEATKVQLHEVALYIGIATGHSTCDTLYLAFAGSCASPRVRERPGTLAHSPAGRSCLPAPSLLGGAKTGANC